MSSNVDLSADISPDFPTRTEITETKTKPSGTSLVSRPQTITITQGNGKTANLTLYDTDTIYDVAQKFNDAIANGLGQGRYTNNPNKFCTIADGTANSSESVAICNGDYEGVTMLIHSAIPGKAGELYFSGDEDLLKALGLNTIQNSEEATYIASVYDAHTGIPVATNVKSSEAEFKSIIPPGIDIEVDSMAGLKTTWDENSKRYVLSGSENYSAFLHLKDNGTVFQVGANKGEDFIIQIGDTSCNAIGISSVNVLTQKTASRAITVIDSAINKIASQRAKIGAYENALEHTMENLTTTSANLISAESRIRDADMSKAMMNFVKQQILNQSGTSMLAQANQMPQSVMSLLN